MNHNCDMSELASRLKKARADAGVSQAELAKRIGAGQSTIASIENGRNNGSGRLVDIAKALKVRREWLASGEGNMRAVDGVAHHAGAPKEPHASPWPFPSIPEAEVRALPPAQLGKLEGAIALAMAQLKIGINVAPPSASTPKAPEMFGSFEDLENPFPPTDVTQIRPSDRDVLTTTRDDLSGLVRFASNDEVVVNVSAGEPFDPNDRFNLFRSGQQSLAERNPLHREADSYLWTTRRWLRRRYCSEVQTSAEAGHATSLSYYRGWSRSCGCGQNGAGGCEFMRFHSQPFTYPTC
jgi:transcriptional regulator with XRE-family HTH domain